MDHDIDQINAVPLVDVMLVLLAIVLTTATFISTGQIPVDLAEAKHATPRQDALIITLKADGQLYLDRSLLSLDDLAPALIHYPKETSFVIRADRTIALDRFVTLVDTVKGLGFMQVSLEVER